MMFFLSFLLMHMWSELHSGDRLLFAKRLHLPLSKTLFISLPGHRDISDERELTSGLSKVLAHIWIVSSNHNSTSK